MKSLQILQGWAYQVVERAAKKLVAEDDLIELKSTWIEPHKAARRIAAQANAARGEDCLWLIGIDESKPDPVVEVQANDPDAWLREVESFFVDKHRPAWRCFQVDYNGRSVYAIAFDTSDFPFLISLKKLNQKANRPEGIAEAEFPWRTGTGVGSASRQQILSLLYRIPPLPDIEVLGSEFLPIAGSEDFNRGFYVKLYVIPRSRDPVIVPFHRVKWTIRLPTGVEREFEGSCQFFPENDYVAWMERVNLGSLLIPIDFRAGVSRPADPRDPIETRASELVIKEPGMIWFVGKIQENWEELFRVRVVSGKILLSVGAEKTILSVNFESRNIFPNL